MVIIVIIKFNILGKVLLFLQFESFFIQSTCKFMIQKNFFVFILYSILYIFNIFNNTLFLSFQKYFVQQIVAQSDLQ